MGDADISRSMEEDAELEALFNEALIEVDEEVDRLFSFINSLRIQNCYMMSRMSYWQSFRDCFTALNLFVVPVMLALGIAYTTAGLLTPGSMTEGGVEMLIMILMYVSMSLGLPLYLLTLCGAYIKDGLAKSETRKNPNESELQESLETVVQFRALARARRRHSQLELGEEEAEVRENNLQREMVSGEFSIPVEDMPAAFNNKEIKSANHQTFDLDIEDFVDAPNAFLDGTSQKEGKELCDVHLFIIHPHEEFLIDFEKDDDGPEVMKIGSVRNIAIENIGEGDRNNTPFTKEGGNCVEIYQTEQGFGL